MALVLNHSVSNKFSSASSGTLTLSNNANAIIVIDVVTERTNAQGVHTTVSSITSANTTGWVQRSSIALDHAGAGSGSINLERWWVYNAAALTNEVYTINTTLTVDDAAYIGYDFTGFTGTSYKTTPWDPNVSFPGTNTDTATTHPTKTTISTTGANCALLWAMGSNNGTGSLSPTTTGSGTATAILNIVNNGGTNFATCSNAYDVVSTAQSGITLAFNNNIASWAILVDALNQNGGTVQTYPYEQPMLGF